MPTTITVYRVRIGPGETYTEFLSLAEAEEYRAEQKAENPVETVTKELAPDEAAPAQ
jgi:hypothetical protein